ncbi:MAG: DUF481 domain-containing protein [SAR86 cluster bacterium]|uniref:DUF481 domain-containing protein n=1 Tax=SAR86 cluster bacterium TaxID=2030880 RepID=A0A937SIB4_9GAMM|nr:DUF481 domain-containing protein [SAR86 cluster bacterium]
MNKTIVIACLLMPAIVLSQPIVNIENLRHSGEIGEFKSVGLSLNGSRGNEDRDDFKLNLSYTKNNDNIESLITLSHSERTKDDVLEDKSSFFHSRLLFKSDKSYDYELYAQSSKNPFQSYKKRDLLGFGMRFDLTKKSKIGLSLLHEKEESLKGINKETDRINLYLYRELELQNDNFLSTSLFYQPSIKELSSDYKISALISLNMPLSEKILIQIQISTAMDNDPPDISKKSNHSFSTNFRYVF